MLHNIGADASITAEAIEARLAGPFLHVGGALVLPGLDDPDGAAHGRPLRASPGPGHPHQPGCGARLDGPLVSASCPRCRSWTSSSPAASRLTPSPAWTNRPTSAARLRELGVRFAIVTEGPHGRVGRPRRLRGPHPGLPGGDRGHDRAPATPSRAACSWGSSTASARRTPRASAQPWAPWPRRPSAPSPGRQDRGLPWRMAGLRDALAHPGATPAER